MPTTEVTAFNPPYEICYRATSGLIPAQVCLRYEEVDGGTQFTYELEVELRGFFRVAEGLLKREAASGTEKELNKLKSILEG